MKTIATLLASSLLAFPVLGCESEKSISICGEYSKETQENFKKPWREANISATVSKIFSEESFDDWENDQYKHLLPLSKKECIVQLKFEVAEKPNTYRRWFLVKGSKECPSIGSKIFGNMYFQILDLNLFIYDATFTVQGV